MPIPAIRCLAVALLLAAFPSIARAQYLYLDADGDGVSTSADAVRPAGATAVDIYLRTDSNRDGTPAVCATADGPLTLRGYEIVLRATNGTVAWGAFTNHIPTMTLTEGPASNESDYHHGYSGGAGLPPGAYRVATLEITVASGTPALDVAPSTGLSETYVTGFHSSCSGLDGDNLLKLGRDWWDADGLPFGGTANRAPILSPLTAMTVAEDAVAEQPLTAQDPDGTGLTFTLVSGPPYAEVVTLDPGTGHATGLARLRPGYENAGSASATVRVSDGLASDEKSFAITVLDVNRPPALGQPVNMPVLEGETLEQFVTGSDPDGDAVTFAKASGPGYMTVDGTPDGAWIRVAPGYEDENVSETGSISATDGVAITVRSFEIMVRNVNRAPVVAAPASASVAEGDRLVVEVSASDPDGETLTLGATPLPPGAVFSDRGDGTGRLEWVPGFDQAGAFPLEFHATDAHGTRTSASVVVTVLEVSSDIALAQPVDMEVVAGESAEQALHAYDASGDPLSFFIRHGPGYLSVSTSIPGDGLAEGLVRALPGPAGAGLDTAWIAVTDGLLSAERSFTIRVLEPTGPPPPPDFEFQAPVVIPVGEIPHTVSAGDLDADGILDLTVANLGSATITRLLGTGDGTFGARVDYPTLPMPHTVLPRDLDGDGRLDLAITQMGGNAIGVMRGNGDGTFGARRDFPIPGSPMILDVEDLNQDGALDIAVTNQTAGTVGVMTNDGLGAFPDYREYETGARSHGMDIADLDRDGAPDLVVANDGAGTLSVLRGAGGGAFLAKTDYVTSSPHIVAAADLNGDAMPDLVVANFHAGTASVLLCETGAALRHVVDLGAGAGAHGVLIRDLNGDARPDIAIANQLAHTLSLYPNEGGGRFGRKTDIAVPAGAHSIAAGDWNRDGAPDLAVSSLYANTVAILLNRAPARLPARAFVSPAERPLPLAGGPPLWPVFVEPVDGAFQADAIVPGSVTLGRESGTGETVPTVPGKTAVVGDRDGNGVNDLQVFFRREDLAGMLGAAVGRVRVRLRCRGSLTGGAGFEAPLELWVVAGHVPGPPVASPNPMNPATVIRYGTSKPGPLRVALFDVHGRLVRTLREEPAAAAGSHETPFDGKDHAGRPLASGTYHVRIESADGTAAGKLSVLK
ncbi:MAG TPA: FG-GAP-like repeat-containing protein [Candidatus Eisenbacteria bacterium]|nr:FG-GAP-like repeat-containing protein [Candidatus Eisenbacteria bacterium]